MEVIGALKLHLSQPTTLLNPDFQHSDLGQVVVGEPGDPRIEVAAPGLKDPHHSWASGISRGKVSVKQGPG